MTIAELEQRVLALERGFNELKARLDQAEAEVRPWWREDAGRFTNDPVFDEIVRLGREYRESLRPKARKRKT